MKQITERSRMRDIRRGCYVTAGLREEKDEDEDEEKE